MDNLTLTQVCSSLLLAGLLLELGTAQDKCTELDSKKIQKLMLDSHYSIDDHDKAQNIILDH